VVPAEGIVSDATDSVKALGGTVHSYSACLRRFEGNRLCFNAGVPSSPRLAPKGALYVGNPQCPLTVTTSFFFGNAVPMDGGAILVRAAPHVGGSLQDGLDHHPPQIRSAVAESTPTIENCVFVGNHANGVGGAVSLQSVTGPFEIRGSVLHGNTACKGGAAAAFSATAAISLVALSMSSNSVVAQGCIGVPAAEWSSGRGGAVYQVRTL